MNNLREVNDDILKDWLEFREETLCCTLSAEDKKHFVYFDEISERILKNVPEQNKKYVRKQLDQLDENFMDYIGYWNEKYYRNGFVDGIQLIGGCIIKEYVNKRWEHPPLKFIFCILKHYILIILLIFYNQNIFQTD